MKNAANIVLLVLSALMVQGSFAGSATWSSDPVSSDWGNPTNWAPNTVPNGPADTATFAMSAQTNVFLSAITEVADITFNSEASAFQITSEPGFTLTFSGAGIINNSLAAQNFVTAVDGEGNRGGLSFTQSAAAGTNSVITNDGGRVAFIRGGETYFFDTATAGDAMIFNRGGPVALSYGGFTWFFGSSSAGNSTISNLPAPVAIGGWGETIFSENSTAGNSIITSSGGTRGEGGKIFFEDNATAGDATVTTNLDHGQFVFTTFGGSSTAGNATIITNGGLQDASTTFLDTTSAGNATLIANGDTTDSLGGAISINDNASGGTARVEVFGKGRFVISLHSIPDVTVGSIEGNGLIDLGSNNLIVGGNGLSTTFGGVVIGTGSVTKVSSAQLILSSANTYTGGTLVERGSLLVRNPSGSATGTGPVKVRFGILGGNGTIAGRVIISGSSPAKRAILAPGSDLPGLLTIQRLLTFGTNGTYTCNLNVTTLRADQVVAAGVTIEDGALISVLARGGTILPPGTAFTVIDNTAATPISGRFSNLAEGATVTIGSNTFQADYEGGDGNDLTLTVVQ